MLGLKLVGGLVGVLGGVLFVVFEICVMLLVIIVSFFWGEVGLGLVLGWVVSFLGVGIVWNVLEWFLWWIF